MKLGKLLLVAVGVTVLLGAFLSSAFARNFSVSEQRVTSLWTLLRISGGFGTVECEVKLSRSFHTRTFTKSVGSLIGYITEGTVLRCRNGGATVNQASLPYHLRYGGFTGTLPNITGQREIFSALEWAIREPTFGIICTVRRSESGTTGVTYAVSSGTITSTTVSSEGTRCEGVAGTFSGTTTNVTTPGGARGTITLI